MKCDDVQAELENSQKEARSHSSEVLKMRKSNEEVEEKMEALKKENRMLASEYIYQKRYLQKFKVQCKVFDCDLEFCWLSVSRKNQQILNNDEFRVIIAYKKEFVKRWSSWYVFFF